MVRLQEENLSDLTRSKKTSFRLPGIEHVYTVGELHAVLKDSRSGEVVDGLHRTKKGWKRVEGIETFDDLDFYLKRLHATVQRRASQAEHEELFSLICGELSKLMPKDQAGQFLRDHISPFERSYTYALIPNMYKRKTSPSGERVQSSDSLPDKVQGNEGATFIRAKDVMRREPGMTSCPNCRVTLRITSLSTLELA